MQKCDAKRPCTACISAETVSECVYANGKRSQPDGACFPHRTNGSLSEQQPGGPIPVVIPTTTPFHLLSDGTFADVPWSVKLDRTPSTSSDATRMVTNFPTSQQAFGSNHVPHGELVLVRKDPSEQCLSLDTSSPAFTVSSFFLPTIPPEPWIPLSFLGEERLRVQISDTAATDLDMKSCVLE
jgi:hypothetical protein